MRAGGWASSVGEAVEGVGNSVRRGKRVGESRRRENEGAAVVLAAASLSPVSVGPARLLVGVTQHRPAGVGWGVVKAMRWAGTRRRRLNRRLGAEQVYRAPYHTKGE